MIKDVTIHSFIGGRTRQWVPCGNDGRQVPNPDTTIRPPASRRLPMINQELQCIAALTAFVAVSASPMAYAAASTSSLGILTPAFPDRVSVTKGNHVLLPFFVGTNMLGASGQTLSRELSRSPRFAGADLAGRFADKLVSAVEATGQPAGLVAITRRRHGEPAPVARDELPESPDGGRFLDVTVIYIGIQETSQVPDLQPSFYATYRVLGRQGDLLQPSRGLSMNLRYTAYDARAKSSVRVEHDAGCGFKDWKEIERAPPELWDCLDQALGELATKIAEDLRRN
jgi:hypothetical protein